MSRFLTITALVLFSLASQAQGPNTGGPGSGGPNQLPQGAPIDGGASLLLAGGAGYILRRLQKRRKARA